MPFKSSSSPLFLLASKTPTSSKHSLMQATQYESPPSSIPSLLEANLSSRVFEKFTSFWSLSD